MPSPRSHKAPPVLVFLLAMACLVHVSLPNLSTAQKKPAAPPKIAYGTSGLPQPVIDMRDLLVGRAREFYGGTAGTANTWKNNTAPDDSSDPSGICGAAVP